MRSDTSPSRIIPPQVGSGSWTPMPRKLGVASAITMKPTPIEARTMRGGTTFGSTWRSRMVSGRVPLTTAASTNSSVLSPADERSA